MSSLAATASPAELRRYLTSLTDRVVIARTTDGAHVTGILTLVDADPGTGGYTSIALMTGQGRMISIAAEGLHSIDPADSGMPAVLNGYPVIAYLPRMRRSEDPRRRRTEAVPGEWVAVCRRTEPEVADRPYCTWRVLRRPDRAGVICEGGVFDLTLPGALEDLTERAGAR